MSIPYHCAICGRIGIPRDMPPELDRRSDRDTLDGWQMPDKLARRMLGVCRRCQRHPRLGRIVGRARRRNASARYRLAADLLDDGGRPG